MNEGQSNPDRKRILTGHRPTGPRHIGHLAGTLENWVRLQDDFECFFLVADLHVLTTDYEHSYRIQDNILEMLADWLAVGIDPQKSTIVLQSALPQHALLANLLSNLVTVARLERVPTYKEQVQQLNLNPSLGLLAYPVLQAADILLYKANLVPVGEDQLPHLELTREIARRFNQVFGATFPEPQELLAKNSRLPGTDNRAMHTSYGNTIALRDNSEETRRKVMSMFTDPTRIHATDPGHIEGNPVFTYLDLFDPDVEQVEELKLRYQAGKIGDVQVKHHLVEVLNEYLSPIRQRRSAFRAHPADLIDILKAGTRAAQPIVQATYEEVQQKMGLFQLNSMRTMISQ
jgi:tryptophanyl-tRNA synthetase